MATQSNSCKLPILNKDRHHLARPALPKKFKSATFKVVFVHLIVRCTLALCPTTLVAFPKRVPWPTIPPRDRPLKDEEAASSAIICKPNKAQALNVEQMLDLGQFDLPANPTDPEKAPSQARFSS